MRTITLSGLAVVLASALGCSGEEPQKAQDELSERPAITHSNQPIQTQPIQFSVAPSNYFINYPTLQDLEDAVNLSNDDQGWKNYLLSLSAKGAEFHDRIQSSLGMSLLCLNEFEHRFNNKTRKLWNCIILPRLGENNYRKRS